MNINTANLVDMYLANLRAYVEDYNGDPIAFTVTGACPSLALIGCIPGSSKMFHEFITPYAHIAAEVFNDRADYALLSAVSKDVVIGFVDAALNRYHSNPNIIYVAVTGALTTNRYRRGDDHAFIDICKNGLHYIYHAKFEKMSESEWKAFDDQGVIGDYRLWQDMILSDWIMQKLVYGTITEFERDEPKFPIKFAVDLIDTVAKRIY